MIAEAVRPESKHPALLSVSLLTLPGHVQEGRFLRYLASCHFMDATFFFFGRGQGGGVESTLVSFG